MPHVSQYRLPPKTERKIRDTFVSVVSSFRKKQDLKDFLEGFLSETEQLMLAKRLLVLYFLEKGMETRKIADAFNVSQATVVRLNLKRQLEHSSLRLAFRKIDRTALKDELIKLAKKTGMEIAVRIAKGGRF